MGEEYEIMETFSERLEHMATEFKDEKYRMLSFTTVENTMVRIEKCSPRKALINTICQELADDIESTIDEGEGRKDIEYMGFGAFQLKVQYKGEEENDSIFIDPDIWESI